MVPFSTRIVIRGGLDTESWTAPLRIILYKERMLKMNIHPVLNIGPTVAVAVVEHTM